MIKYKANKLRSKYQINSKSSLEYLKLVIHKLGYNLSTYSEEKLKLIRLKREKEMQTAPALTIIDSNCNITVYYNDKLSPIVQRFALAHEIGHIVLNHKHRNINGKKQEYEADRFAEYLLAPYSSAKLNALQINCLILCACLCVVMIYSVFREETSDTSLSSQATAPEQNNAETTNNNQLCYYTKSGEVYHIYRDCYYIKNSKNVTCNTISNSNKKRLCSACEDRHNLK